MTHCTHCGGLITRGRDPEAPHPAKAVRCLVCQTAQAMTTFRYVSPYAKRYRAKREQSK